MAAKTVGTPTGKDYVYSSSSELDIAAALKVWVSLAPNTLSRLTQGRNRLDGYEKPLPYSTLLKRPELRHRGSNLSPNSELYVTVQPFADSKPLTVHSQTAYKHFKSGRVWNQWLVLPVDYSSLPCNTLLAITIWDFSPENPQGGDKGHHIPFGGTTIPLYDETAELRTGRQKCMVWRHRVADGCADTSTPWERVKAKRRDGRADEGDAGSEKRSREAELDRLVNLMKKHEMRENSESKWLDQMVFRQIEKLERAGVRDGNELPPSTRVDGGVCAEGDPDHVDGSFTLYIEFPRFNVPIVFTDHEYPPPPLSSARTLDAQPPTTAVNFKPPPEVQLGPGIDSDGGAADPADAGATSLIRIYDPEVGHADSPAETKHRRLIRGQRNALDRDLKPNPKTRDFLNRVLTYGPTAELSDKEKDEVWRFRHHLTRDKRALTKFVKSVNWAEPGESRQAIALLPKWAEIDVDDALELLGPGVQNAAVRAYAVERLRKADDDELLLYLLQLVQALQFEPATPPPSPSTSTPDSSLAAFLVARAAATFPLANFLHWYLMVELDDAAPAPARQVFARASYALMRALDASAQGRARRALLLRQAEVMAVLARIARDVRRARGDRLLKIDMLRRALAEPRNGLLRFEPPLPLPLDPDVRVTGIVPAEASVFKSSLFPLYLSFRTAGGGEASASASASAGPPDDGARYALIFKSGDDLRQDQLVVQIIALMDRLLRKENLDLHLTPYRILATSSLAGAVQFVPNTPLGAILSDTATYKASILGYLRHHNGAPTAPLGVRKRALDTYVRSVAGYSVITYLLGIGDRHLDNLLLAPDGRFFHIDFGYILGRDPKPLAPLMKLSREMVAAMGGPGSARFADFRQYCFTAYSALRRASALILNLLALMQHARIPGLDGADPAAAAAAAVPSSPAGAGGVGGATPYAVRKVEERFKLDLSEEEALALFAQLIDRELGAWGAQLIDRLHGLAQGWRA